MKVALLAWLLWPAWAAAATPPRQAWTIDAAQSRVTFTVSKFWFARVRGTFPGLSGALHAERSAGAARGRVDARVDVSALEMADADDRARALGPDFFDVARYPDVRFASDPFPLDELVAGGKLAGTLTLHGVERRVLLVLEPSTCPGEPLYCVIRLRGTVSRGAFGMRSLRGILGEKVKLDLRILLRDAP